MEKTKNITVNGVEFTPKMLEVLEGWSKKRGEDNEPL